MVNPLRWIQFWFIKSRTLAVELIKRTAKRMRAPTFGDVADQLLADLNAIPPATLQNIGKAIGLVRYHIGYGYHRQLNDLGYHAKIEAMYEQQLRQMPSEEYRRRRNMEKPPQG